MFLNGIVFIIFLARSNTLRWKWWICFCRLTKDFVGVTTGSSLAQLRFELTSLSFVWMIDTNERYTKEKLSSERDELIMVCFRCLRFTLSAFRSPLSSVNVHHFGAVEEPAFLIELNSGKDSRNCYKKYDGRAIFLSAPINQTRTSIFCSIFTI